MSKIRILMADDEPDILEIMAKKIANEGYEVLTAQDGKEAWYKIQHVIPDIVILDLTMPEMTGFEVLKNLRDNPPAKKWIPVIIVSALGEMDSMKKGMELQADHYIVKPCQVSDIISSIKLMLTLREQRISNG